MESSKYNESAECDRHLGSNEFVEILTWMPAKEVIKFSSLSKTICALLSGPSFAKTHCIRSSVKDGGLFLQHDMYWRFDKLEFHVPPEDGEPPPSTNIPSESLSFIAQTGRILASSEGLLLLYKIKVTDVKNKNFFICNPTTRRCAPLPIPEWLKSRECDYRCGGPLLECHPRDLKACPYIIDWDDDYSVIIPIRNEEDSDYHLAVYRNGKWEEIMCNLSIEGRELRLDMPVCLFKGWNRGIVMHYLCVRNVARKVEEPYMVAYDVGRKAVSRTFKLPDGAWENKEYQVNHDLKLLKWRSSSPSRETICIVRKHRKDYNRGVFIVWVLEDYESGLWRVVVQKTTAEMGVVDPEKEIDSSYSVVANASGMGLVFATGTRVYVYQMDGPHSGRLEVVGEHGYGMAGLAFMPYTNTLRPVSARETQLLTF